MLATFKGEKGMEQKSIGEKWIEAELCMKEAADRGWELRVHEDNVYFEKVITSKHSVHEHGCPDAIIAAFKEIPTN